MVEKNIFLEHRYEYTNNTNYTNLSFSISSSLCSLVLLVDSYIRIATYMYFGAHVSIAGGIDKAPERAAEIGCEVFQIFSRPPQGGNATKISDGLFKSFQENLKKHNQKEFYIHTPYIINLASQESRIRGNSIRLIREDLQRGSLLGAKYVMTHLGSAKELDKEIANKMVVENLKRIFDKQYKTQLLIEISAGAGNIIGSTFEDLAYFIENLKGYKIGICLDTAHMFASGYDLRTKEAVKNTFDEFDKIVGFQYLKMFHVNDSKVGFGEHKDRHEHIGNGNIGLKGFEAMMQDKRLQPFNFICETESDSIKEDILLLKKLRSGSMA